MHKSLHLDIVVSEVMGYLSPESACESASVHRCWRDPATASVDTAYKAEFAAAFPCAAARHQLVRLLGAPMKPARAALAWRRRALKHARKLEMLQSAFTHTSIGAARLEGSDIFAACKRAVLFSDEPDVPEVKRWMAHIVEAVESRDFEHSMPAWRWFAEHGLLADGGARWLVELAHALGNMRDAAPIIAEYPEVRRQVEAYAASLTVQPNLGRYTFTHYGCLRDRDVRRLLASAA